MSIDFTCSGCSKTLRVPDEHLGKQARCPQCQTLNLIQPNSDPVAMASAGDFSEPVQQFGVAEKQPLRENPYQATSVAPAGRMYQMPHRGGLILTLGILGLVCNVFCIPSIMAWVMGRSDLAKIRAGMMDREGEGLTQAGMIMGIIATCLVIVVVLFYLAMIVFVVIAAIAGAN